MAQNPYRMSLRDLERSTGHAQGGPTVEIEPELEVPHELPIRVTPMSPVTEIQAFGQLTQARPERRRLSRVVALVFLAGTVIGLVQQLVVLLRQ